LIDRDRTPPSDENDPSASERGGFIEANRPTWVRIDARCRRAWLAGASVGVTWVALIFVPLLIVRLSQSTFGQFELGLFGRNLEAVLGIALGTLRAAAFGSAVAIAIWIDLLARSTPVWGAFGPRAIERTSLGAWWRWLERALPAPCPPSSCGPVSHHGLGCGALDQHHRLDRVPARRAPHDAVGMLGVSRGNHGA
jgi:hypothetical protein